MRPILFLFLIFPLTSYAQLQQIIGKVVANDDVEGIHVLNKTALKFTTTDTDGRFEINAKVNDTLTISGLKYNLVQVVVNQYNIDQNSLTVYLTDKVNQLDEVILGTVLTGSLSSDLKNLDVKTPINFYDLGIPGYTGKHKTLAERKLAEATSSGGGIPLFAIINAISGRTKKLKEQLQVERDIQCMEDLKSEYEFIIFNANDTQSSVRTQFFNYILDSENFRAACKSKNPLNRIGFLQTELKTFNQISRKD